MKRLYTLVSLFLSLSAAGFAQGEMDAFNLSYGDLTGTARSVGMGGAVGALGGDISGVATNPAGLGSYSSYEVVTTLNFTNSKTKTNLFGFKDDDSKFKFEFDNIAFVGIVPINSDEVPRINFGISYNKLKSFDRNISMRGQDLSTSLVDFMTERANSSSYGNVTGNNPYSTGDSWLGILGYQGGLVLPNESRNGFVPLNETEAVDNSLRMREKGDISSYDFNIGTTISDIISIGATLSLTDVNYRLTSDYHEAFLGNSGDDYYLQNWLKTEGTGWQLKAGVIFQPIYELRLGVAYHSPTWYNLTDYYYAELDASTNTKIQYTPDNAFTDYKLRTPDKWVFSLSTLLGKAAVLSADYELTNYSNMHLKDRDGYEYTDANDYIKEDFRNSSTFRIGAEIFFTPQFTGRVGYMWQQSPVKDILKDGSETGKHTAAVEGTIPQYSVVGDANYITYGLGYKFKSTAPRYQGERQAYFYTDIAFVMKNRKDDFYVYPMSDKTELKNNTFSGLLTLGYKF